MFVEVMTGSDERPEARVVQIDDLTSLHLALGQVTDDEAAEVLERSGLGRLQDADTAFLDVAALLDWVRQVAPTAQWLASACTAVIRRRFSVSARF